VRSAGAHYAAAADFRRELRAMGAEKKAPRRKKAKKAARQSPRASLLEADAEPDDVDDHASSKRRA
jgi:hypothetical protein